MFEECVVQLRPEFTFELGAVGARDVQGETAHAAMAAANRHEDLDSLGAPVTESDAGDMQPPAVLERDRSTDGSHDVEIQRHGLPRVAYRCDSSVTTWPVKTPSLGRHPD